ncbi:MAG: tetratricopeptide repeat protein [Flavobacteriales bacterium]|nr:tetratricopeptide repeat protein [Flavobacteriales bacterium]
MKRSNCHIHKIAILFVLLLVQHSHAQLRDQEKMDSMFEELKTLADSAKADQLNRIAWEYIVSNKAGNARQFIDEALDLSRALNYNKGEAQSLNYIGVVYQSQSNFAQAYNYYLQSLEKNKEAGNSKGIAFSNQSIGVIYYIQGNYEEAINYYNAALDIYKQIGDQRGIAQILSNIAGCHVENGDYEKGLQDYMASYDIYVELGSDGGMCIQETFLGENYRRLGEFDKSLEHYENALELAEKAGRKNLICSSLIGMGITKIKMQDFEEARVDLNTALALSRDLESFSYFRDIHQNLSKLDSIDGKWNSAYVHHLKFIAYRDSAKNNKSSKETVKAQMKFSFDQQEAEIRAEQEKKDIRQKFIRNIIGGGLVGSMIFGFVVFRQRNKTAKEKKRSDALLLNILPQEIAEELKEKGEAEARQYDMVSVLFTDFVQFTKTAEKLSPKELVSEINECFRAFDLIVEKHKIEKIKTIGDAYMAAGGLPVQSMSAVKHTVLAAIEMQNFIEKRKKERDLAGQPAFEMRVGIHTGSVVAGIVGLKKFQYDIWGDVVNTASRMESNGEVNKVNISKETYDLIKDDPTFSFEYRGKIEAKGKGAIDMWFVGI